MMGFRNVPLPRSAVRCPSLPRAQCSGAFGGWGSAEGCDSAAIASVFEPAAVAVAPSNSDFKVWRREYFISPFEGWPSLAGAIIFVVRYLGGIEGESAHFAPDTAPARLRYSRSFRSLRSAAQVASRRG